MSFGLKGLFSSSVLRQELAVANRRIYQLEAEAANMRRVQGVALLVAFNGGPQFAKFLEETELPAIPVLAPDGQSVLVEFSTLTITFSPFEEMVYVTMIGGTERQKFHAPNGVLSVNSRQLILGLLEISNRTDKSLPDVALTGVVVADDA
jgi:hypothetical protein